MSNPEAPQAAPPSLFALFSVFFRIGLFSFGGGLSGWVYREAVQTRRWLEEDTFLSGMALAQVLPGANIANLAVYVGHRLHGALGAVTAVVALLSGPFFAVIGLASVYGVLRDLPFAEAALEGVAAAAIGMLLLVVWKGAQRAARRPAALLAFAATFVAVGLLHWSLLAVVAVVGPLSVAAAWPREPDA
jgi:chromate transporter